MFVLITFQGSLAQGDKTLFVWTSCRTKNFSCAHKNLLCKKDCFLYFGKKKKKTTLHLVSYHGILQ